MIFTLAAFAVSVAAAVGAWNLIKDSRAESW